MGDLQNLKDSALNNLHSVIYNIPSDIHAEVKLDEALQSLHYILNFHLEQIRIKCNDKFKETGPTTKNKYINNPNTNPKPSDEIIDYNFDLF